MIYNRSVKSAGAAGGHHARALPTDPRKSSILSPLLISSRHASGLALDPLGGALDGLGSRCRLALRLGLGRLVLDELVLREVVRVLVIVLRLGLDDDLLLLRSTSLG
jgi:hypothetical protein